MMSWWRAAWQSLLPGRRGPVEWNQGAVQGVNPPPVRRRRYPKPPALLCHPAQPQPLDSPSV
ncbi:MCRS1 isoform 4 [Pongo abelii]|uniref:MCRS1 isoform 4 n=1 Tax=Pongo abelii TaxID=9601 RepID=A0A2J8SYH8_PONAB|nr:MCRS1 isoform 4 [Pongo abelii]